MPKIILNSLSSDKNLPAPRQLFIPQDLKNKSSESNSNLNIPKEKKKIHTTIQKIFNNRSYVNLSVSQKSILKNIKDKKDNLNQISIKDVRFDPQ